MQDGSHADLGKIVFLLLCVLSALFLFGAYLYPFHIPPWLTFHNELAFAMFVLLGCGAVAASGQMALPHPGWWALLVGSVALHYGLWQQHDPFQQDIFIQWMVFGVVGYAALALGLSVRSHKTLLNGVVTILLVAALASVAVAAYQWMSLAERGAPWSQLLRPRGMSFIGQANNFGTLCVLGLWALAYLVYRQDGGLTRGRGFAAALAMLVLTAGVYLSGSRTAFLNVFLAPVLIGAAALAGKRRFGIWFAVPALLLAGLLLGLPWLEGWLAPSATGETVAIARSFATDSARMKLWSVAWEAIKDAPLLGHGFASFPYYYMSMSPEIGDMGGSVPMHAHNTVLDLWLTFGVPLGSVLVLVVAWAWWNAWRKNSSLPSQSLCLMCTAMLVHGLTEYPLHYGFFFWLLCFLFGVLVVQPWRNIDFLRPTRAALLWVVVTLSGVYPFWSGYAQVEDAFRMAGRDTTRNVLMAVDRVGFFGNAFYGSLLLQYKLVLLPISEQISDSELHVIESMARRLPQAELMWRVAIGHAFQGRFEQAAWWVQRICTMFPGQCSGVQAAWEQVGKNRAVWPVMPWELWRQPGRP